MPIAGADKNRIQFYIWNRLGICINIDRCWKIDRLGIIIVIFNSLS